MKKNFVLLAFGLFFLSQAAISAAASNNGEVKEAIDAINDTSGASTDTLVTDLELCVRDIVENKIGGIAGIDVSAKLLNAALASASNKSDMVALNSGCRSFKKRTGKSKISRNDQLTELAKSGAVGGARTVIGDFISPKTVCKRYSGVLSAAALLAVDVSAAVLSCEATNGKRWLEFSPGVGIGIGLGGNLDFGCSTDFRDNARWISGTGADIDQLGLIVSKMAPGGNFSVGFSDNDDFDDKVAQGYGIGLLGGEEKAGSANFKVIPLTSDRQGLFDLLRFSEIPEAMLKKSSDRCVTSNDTKDLMNIGNLNANVPSDTFASGAR